MSQRKNELEEKINKLEEELEKVKKQAKEYLEGWKRAKADYLNREREIQREREEWIKLANLNLILEILPIYENFNQALEYKDKNEDFLKGIEQIKKQFDDLFKKLKLEKIKTVGEKFNPEFHEVVARETTEEMINDKKPIADEIIVKEVSPGYTLDGKVIKVAKVIIK